MRKTIFCVVLLALCTACSSSYHNINEHGANPFGGGFQDREVDEGMYFIIAKTNFKPWVNYSGAYKTFNRRAVELCGSEDYTVLKNEEADYEHISSSGEMGYIISQVSGYVLCGSSAVTTVEAEKIILSDSKKIWFAD
ncbi:hypothetical protein AUP74_03048 [Microbulbifer aggregans]|uniref:Lipoprotein n=1 Tax=Microbulbifer aggregans TaxID=1769779 RepID=A0A1C9WB92_9GAMM|nr:hypothetical protein [Microbulbifer aggregans]AOS98414.1 hypothetical protein AUP74_03048 [Microbulbifer aggregans]